MQPHQRFGASAGTSAEYHQRIQQAIDESDFLIFLLSADSVQRGSYVLTELKAARQKWPFVIDWGTIQPGLLEDYELDESDFEPAGGRPEADVRFLDSEGRRWLLRGAVLTLMPTPSSEN